MEITVVAAAVIVVVAVLWAIKSRTGKNKGGSGPRGSSGAGDKKLK